MARELKYVASSDKPDLARTYHHRSPTRSRPRSLRGRRVIVDSSAYLALLDRRDEHNREASVSW